jgi:hypothetical protein
MEKDTLTGIIGALALVGVMVGVFAYEYQNAPAMDEDMVLTTSSGPSLSGTTAVTETSTETATITQDHVRNVTFTLTWTEGVAPDTMKIHVVGPGGEATGEDQSDSGIALVTVPVPEGEDGMGDWTVHVEFVSAESSEEDLPLGLDDPTNEPTSDTSVSWMVAVSVEHLVPASEAPAE